MGTGASAGVAPWSARACDRGWCGRGDGGERSEREHGQRDPVERRSAGRLDRLAGDGDRIRRYLGRRAGHGHGQHRAWRSGRDDHLRDGLLGQYGESGRRVRHDPRLREDVLRGAQRGGGRGRVDRRGRRREVRQLLLARTRAHESHERCGQHGDQQRRPREWHELCRWSFRGADAGERHDERHQDRGVRLGRPLQRRRERLRPGRRSGYGRCDRALDRDRRW